MNNLPTYYFFSFYDPVGADVVKDLQKIRRLFLWSGRDKQRCLAAVKWDQVIKTKKFGGLGLGDLKTKNQALLTKCVWRYGNEAGTPWRNMVKDNFGSSNGKLWLQFHAGTKRLKFGRVLRKF